MRDRLQPEQPDAPRRCRRPRSTSSWPSVPRNVAVILDEAYVEFSTLQDPDESLDLLEAPPQPGPAAHLLEGLRPLRPARGLRARLRGVPARGRPRAPAVLASTRSRRPPRPRRSTTRTRWSGAWSRRRSSACTWSRSSRSAGSRRPTARRTSPGSSLGDRDEDAVVDGLAERGVIVRAGGALGQEGWMRVTYGTRHENDRFLAALDEVALSLLQRFTVTRLATPSCDPSASVRPARRALSRWYSRFS